jgi:hypothetical protein
MRILAEDSVEESEEISNNSIAVFELTIGIAKSKSAELRKKSALESIPVVLIFFALYMDGEYCKCLETWPTGKCKRCERRTFPQ